MVVVVVVGYLVEEGMAPHSGATTQPHLESGGQMGGRTLYSGGGWGVTGGAVGPIRERHPVSSAFIFSSHFHVSLIPSLNR